MATVEEAAPTAVGAPDVEALTQEDAVWEEYCKTPERRHVDVLLDISEEDSMREEEEPYEYHCYSGAEEAKKYKKPKQKEADNPTLTSVDPTIPTADSVASSESTAGSRNNLKKSTPLNEQVGSWSNTTVAALQTDASERPVLSALQKTTSHLSLEGKMKEHILRETPVQLYHLSTKQSESKPTKPQRDSHRPSNALVPIKNFTFLPPIKAPHLNPKICGQLSSGMKASEGETFEENCFTFDKKSETRGTRADPAGNTELPNNSAALTSKNQTCQHNPQMLSALSVSVSKRYQEEVSQAFGMAGHSLGLCAVQQPCLLALTYRGLSREASGK
ncbi:hypothetical protein INR49_012345 [Caranx melampygus]|nr:hypothetical protein INR49_012345 [Caranx melampygus]